MSVIIQTLLHNPLIRSYYLSNGHNSTDCKIEYCVSCALDEIFTEFYTTEKTEGFGAVTMLMNTWKTAEVSTTRQRHTHSPSQAMNNGLAGYHQQDAHEYMQFLLNALHTANGGLAHEADCECVVHKTFSGKLQSVVTCDKCNNRTIAHDPFMDLSLDLRSHVKHKLGGDKKKDKDDGSSVMKLEDCLKRFTSSERLPAAEYRCRNCDAPRDATKQFGILKLPPCLCIHLKVGFLTDGAIY
jgi:ubiquitin carboxyl-terminal hydrolase 22/27/51